MENDSVRNFEYTIKYFIYSVLLFIIHETIYRTSRMLTYYEKTYKMYLCVTYLQWKHILSKKQAVHLFENIKNVVSSFNILLDNKSTTL